MTSCLKCQLKWVNTDERDYTNDYCMVCRGKLVYEGKQDVKMGGVMSNPNANSEIGFNEVE